jgi:cell division transport system permease protein
VATVTLVSKEQALNEFRRQFPAEDYLLDGLGDNPLPASLVIGLAPAYRSSAYVKQWAEHLKNFPGVAHVQYSREWLDNVSTLLSYLELAAAAVGIVLSVASVTIIANTIRLTLYARRDEIEIMRLIGATGAFIKVPYVIEGALLGMLGAVLSIGLLKGMLALVQLHLGTPGPVLGVQASLGFLPFAVSAGIVGGGLALGCIGSLVSLVELKEVQA